MFIYLLLIIISLEPFFLFSQVEKNIEFTNARRVSTELSPNSPAVESFLQVS